MPFRCLLAMSEVGGQFGSRHFRSVRASHNAGSRVLDRCMWTGVIGEPTLVRRASTRHGPSSGCPCPHVLGKDESQSSVPLNIQRVSQERCNHRPNHQSGSGYSIHPAPWPVAHRWHSSPGATGEGKTAGNLIGASHRAHRCPGSSERPRPSSSWAISSALPLTTGVSSADQTTRVRALSPHCSTPAPGRRSPQTVTTKRSSSWSDSSHRPWSCPRMVGADYFPRR